jgi:peptidoglycan/xylan/chitin deacetylase (PgdA/CDA1 family)
MPILNTLGIPATFYVIVDCIENRTLPWPARLRYALRKTTIDSWTDETGKTWKLFDAAARDGYFVLACETACRMDSKSRQEFLIRLQRTMRVDEPREAGCLMMTLEQLQTLTHRGHVVGSHTMTHPNLAYLDANESQWEISESKRRLESWLGTPIKRFAYPCPALSPHWNERTISQCGEVGYESAVTTDDGLMERGKNLLCLPRIRPTKSVEGLRWNLESAFAGRAAK